MPRKVGERSNYLEDSRYISRLQQSIELDTINSVEWKKRGADLCKELAIHLMLTDANDKQRIA